MTAFEPTSGQDRQAPLDPPNPQGGLGGSSRPRGLLSHAKKAASEGNTPPPASANPAPVVPPNQQNKPKNSLLGFAAQAQQQMQPGQQMGPPIKQPGPGPQGPFPPNQPAPQAAQPWGAPPNQQRPPQPGINAQPWPQPPAQMSPSMQPNTRMPAPPPASPVPAGLQPQRMEVVNGHLILHRGEHFWSWVVSRPSLRRSRERLTTHDSRPTISRISVILPWPTP